MKAPSRVLVTGAAGEIGRAVLARLAAEGVAVTALVLADPGDLGEARVVVGNAGDPAAVRDALDGVDAVVHMAAIPSPSLGSALEVFGGNTQATFVTLEEAAQAGVRRAVIASSYSILGITFPVRPKSPVYYPIDEDAPLRVEDPYGLSKQVDEATGAMMHRRYGMDVVALRLPLTAPGERLALTARLAAEEPGKLAYDSWSYLHVDDAAQAAWLGLTVPVTGFHPVFLAAPQTLSPYPTEDLIAAYHPSTLLRKPLPGRTAPIDSSAVRALLGFTARHVLDIEERPLP